MVHGVAPIIEPTPTESFFIGGYSYGTGIGKLGETNPVHAGKVNEIEVGDIGIVDIVGFPTDKGKWMVAGGVVTIAPLPFERDGTRRIGDECAKSNSLIADIIGNHHSVVKNLAVVKSCLEEEISTI